MKVIQIFDINKTKICDLKEYENIKIESFLESGDESLSFYMRRNNEFYNNILEECYVRTEDQEYVIKNKKIINEEYGLIECQLNLEDLEAIILNKFDNSRISIDETMNKVLLNTGWSFNATSSKKLRRILKIDSNVLDVIKNIFEVYNYKPIFNTLSKTVSVRISEDKGIYNFDEIKVKRIGDNSYDYATRMIPKGINNLDISKINNKKNYIENHTHSNKIKTIYWKNTNYSNIEDLKEDAEVRLEELSRPRETFIVKVNDLAQISKKGISEYHLGDKITNKNIIKTGILTIIRLINYPNDIYNNLAIVSNCTLNFSTSEEKLKEIANLVSNAILDDGTINGKVIDNIDINQIQDFKNKVSDVAQVNKILSQIDEMSLNKVNVAELNVTKAKINNLEVTGTATIRRINATDASIENLKTHDLTAINANIKNLKVDKAEVNDLKVTNEEVTNLKAENVSIKNAAVENLKATNAEIITLKAQKASIDDLTATSADIKLLKAKTAKIDTLSAEKASINDLNAFKVNTQELIAKKADIGELTTLKANINELNTDKANISDLTVINGNIHNLQSDTANIKTLVNGNLSSENIQTAGITSDRLTIANGFIKDAMIDSIVANKINSGELDTSKVNIQSRDGNLVIKDNTIQIKDTSKVRVQIGKDSTGDYSMYVWDKNGSLMFDATGLKSNAIKDSIIRDDMISQNANIDFGKVNIESAFREINNSKNTIKASKINLDKENQTLDIAFSQMITSNDKNSKDIENALTKINVQQGQISANIENSKVIEGKEKTLEDNYNRTVATVGEISNTLGQQKTLINSVTGKIDGVEVKANTIKKTLDSTVETLTQTNKTVLDNKTLLNTKTSELKHSIDGLSANISNTQQTTEGKINTLNSSTANLQAGLNGISAKLNSMKKTTDGLNTSIKSNTTEIKAVKGEISSKVSESTLSNTVKTINDSIKIVTDRASENASQLKQTKDSLTASVNSLNSKTETINGNINTINSDLLNKINTNLNTAKSYADSSSNNAKSQAIKQAEDNTVNAINNIEVGGRNLALNSRKEKTIARNLDYYISTGIFKGEVYTYSVWLKANRECTVNVYLNDDTGKNRAGIWFDSSKKVTTEYKKYTFTQVSTAGDGISTDNIKIRVYGVEGDIITGKLAKLEKGTKCTDYTEAPEDINESFYQVAEQKKQDAINSAKAYTTAQITTTNSNLSKTTSEIKILKGDISTKVGQTDIDRSISNIKFGGRNLLTKMSEYTQNNKYTITATRDDNYIHTKGRVNLVEGQTYTFSMKTTGKMDSSNSTDSVEAYLLLNGQYQIIIGIAQNPKTFTCTNTGEYQLRLDVNQKGKTHSFWDIKIESGTIASDWSPAPEDINQAIIDSVKKTDEKISTVETELKQTKESFGVSVNSLNSKTSTIETNIANTTENLTSKINTAKTDAINYSKSYSDTKKSEAISSANSHADGIAASKANDSLNNAKTYTNTQITATNSNLSKATSEINILKEQINTKVGQVDVNKSIQEIKIGGRNLYKDSQNFRFEGSDYGNPALGEVGVITVPSQVTGFNAWKFIENNLSANLDTSKPYCISLDIKTNGTGKKIYFHFDYRGKKPIVEKKVFLDDLRTEWKRYTIKMPPNAGSSRQILISIGSDRKVIECTRVEYKNLKIEEGTTDTDYTVAPEDLNSLIINNIKVVTDKINDVSTKLVQTKDSLQASVNSLNSNTQTITTNLTNASTLLNGKIDKAKIDAINNAVNQAKSIADSKKNEAINHADSKANQVKGEAINSANSYTNSAKQQAIDSANSHANSIAEQKKNEANGYTNTQISTVNSKVSNVQSSLNVLKNEINTKVSQSDIDRTVNNIEFGGRNLIPNSYINAETSAYGSFGKALTMHLEEGKTYCFSIRGHIDKVASDNGKSLTCFIYEDTWSYGSVSINIFSVNSNETKYALFIPKKTGVYKFAAYMYPSGGNREGKVALEWAKLEKGTKPTDWSPAPEDINQAIKDNITTVTEKIKTAESSFTQKTNSINSKVSQIESTSNSLNGKITSNTNRISNAESNITPSAIVNSVNSNIASGGAIKGTSTILDKDKLTIKDSDNSRIELQKGGITAYNTTNKKTYYMSDGEIGICAKDNSDPLGMITSVYKKNLNDGISVTTPGGSIKGVGLFAGDYANYLTFGHDDIWGDDSKYDEYLTFNKKGWGHLYTTLDFHDNQVRGLTSINRWGKEATLMNTICISGNQVNTNSTDGDLWLNGAKGIDTYNAHQDDINVRIGRGWNNGQHGGLVCQDLWVHGNKHRIVDCGDLGFIGMEAYETSSPYFGDIGNAKLDENGVCYIVFDREFMEVADTKVNYKVDISIVSENLNTKVQVAKKFIDKVKIIGTPGTEFDFEIKAVQKGIEEKRFKKIPEKRSEKTNYGINNEVLGMQSNKNIAKGESIMEDIELLRSNRYKELMKNKKTNKAYEILNYMEGVMKKNG